MNVLHASTSAQTVSGEIIARMVWEWLINLVSLEGATTMETSDWAHQPEATPMTSLAVCMWAMNTTMHFVQAYSYFGK